MVFFFFLLLQGNDLRIFLILSLLLNSFFCDHRHDVVHLCSFPVVGGAIFLKRKFALQPSLSPSTSAKCNQCNLAENGLSLSKNIIFFSNPVIIFFFGRMWPINVIFFIVGGAIFLKKIKLPSCLLSPLQHRPTTTCIISLETAYFLWTPSSSPSTPSSSSSLANSQGTTHQKIKFFWFFFNML